jgi:hypothetical protein
LFNIRLVPLSGYKMTLLLKCIRDDLPMSINSVRLIFRVDAVIVGEVQIMNCVFVNTTLVIPFHIRSTSYMGIGVKLCGSRRRQIHVR